MTRTVCVLLALVLSGCQRDPAAPTAEEDRQLDEAANLLNQAPANLEAIDDGALAGTNEIREAAPDEGR
jgi:hypothetical protein